MKHFWRQNSMRFRWTGFFLVKYFLFFSLSLGTLVWGQAKPTDAAPAKSPASASDDDDRPVPPSPSAAAVALDAPVLTIKGFCPDSAKPGNSTADCKKVITREEFEKVARAIQPSLSPVVKRQLLSLYPRLLIMTHEAEARGLDKEEYFQQMLAYARMQILTQQLTHELQQEAANVPEPAIADYYQKHPETFTQYNVERIFIPRAKQEPPPAAKLSEAEEKEREKNAELEMTKLAEALHARAAKGESFETLQKEAYQVAGLKSNPPNASMGRIRRTGLPPGHDAVFNLKVGEVSSVFSDSGGHTIYRVDAITMETQAEAKDEIHSLLKSQRMRESMEKITGPFSTEVNDAYFDVAKGSAQGSAAGTTNSPK
jgi:hypothetical protein